MSPETENIVGRRSHLQLGENTCGLTTDRNCALTPSLLHPEKETSAREVDVGPAEAGDLRSPQARQEGKLEDRAKPEEFDVLAFPARPLCLIVRLYRLADPF